MQAYFCRKVRCVPQLGNVPPLAGSCDRDQRTGLFQRHQGQRS